MGSTELVQLLFARESLASYLEQRIAAARAAIDQWDPSDLLTTSPQDVIDWVWERYTVQMPVLRRSGIEALPAEEGYSKIPDGFEGFQPMPVITRRFVIPIEGESDVLLYKASQRSMNPPTGNVERFDGTHGELLVRLQGPPGQERAAQQVNTALHEHIDRVDHCLNLARPDIDRFLERLRSTVQGVHDRRVRLLAEREVEQALGYPVRRRTDASSFAVSVTPRTLRPNSRPSGARTPYRPEPVLEDSDYEEVLRVLINSRNALERSPSTTKMLGEEAIRDILIVNLNSAFEGRAGAEMFNGAGKTDILVRDHDRNIFIGECKIWRGPTSVTGAIDQLLSYLVWRDTKAALLVFIRGGNPTEISAKAAEAIETHPHYKRTVRNGTAGDRNDFVLRTAVDADREIRLALLPFVLPA